MTDSAVHPEAFKAAADYAQTLVGWTLLMLGGSAAGLLQTSYRRPRVRWLRVLHALALIPGWIFLGISIYSGTRAYQVFLAYSFNPSSRAVDFRMAINRDLSSQIEWLRLGISFLAAWLLLVLLYWVCAENKKREVSTC
jgi:hypothetical protein